jgi:AAA+ superfamily predicted ATPase
MNLLNDRSFAVMKKEQEVASNTVNLLHAFDLLKTYLQERLSAHFAVQDSVSLSGEIEVPQLAFYDDQSAMGNFIKLHQPTCDEFMILLLALVPHVRPNFLNVIIKDCLPKDGDFPEIGGGQDKDGRCFLPTGETILFFLAGEDFDKRFEVQRILSGDHWFAKENIVKLAPAKDGEPFWSGRLLLSPEYIELFTLGHISTPTFSGTFPAQEIKTDLEWHDLILNEGVQEQIEELKRWIEHHHTLQREWGMYRKMKPGYRVLFCGPPGTGKTLTATLLGKYTGRKVFRIDLSTVVSKYIGETEKNLSGLFDKAKNKNWILFFDEADALFGKRTTVKDAHDRYANQEVSYLLQRVEEFDGLVILASNFKANLDEAFLRRFNAIIKFPFPSEEERVAIWRTSLPAHAEYEHGVDLPAQLGKFELAGGNIINVVQHASIEAIARNSKVMTLKDALKGVRREVEKEGKVFKNVIKEEDGFSNGRRGRGETERMMTR